MMDERGQKDNGDLASLVHCSGSHVCLALFHVRRAASVQNSSAPINIRFAESGEPARLVETADGLCFATDLCKLGSTPFEEISNTVYDGFRVMHLASDNVGKGYANAQVIR